MTKAESANIKGAQAIEDVTTAMHFQAAQLGDGEAALSTATTIWQTFRKEAAQAGREVLTTGNIIDLIARTAQVGEGNVEDFSMAIKRVAPNAAALGLTETQFAAMVATISQVAPTVDEGSTQLDSFLTSMVKTTPAAETGLQEARNHDYGSARADQPRRDRGRVPGTPTSSRARLRFDGRGPEADRRGRVRHRD